MLYIEPHAGPAPIVPVGIEYPLRGFHDGRIAGHIQILPVLMKGRPVKIGGTNFRLVTGHHILGVVETIVPSTGLKA